MQSPYFVKNNAKKSYTITKHVNPTLVNKRKILFDAILGITRHKALILQLLTQNYIGVLL